LIYNGEELEKKEWPEGLHEGEVVFAAKLADAGWYHVILKGEEDAPLLWTNPVWVVK
jgi:hypothetical protein